MIECNVLTVFGSLHTVFSLLYLEFWMAGSKKQGARGSLPSTYTLSGECSLRASFWQPSFLVTALASLEGGSVGIWAHPEPSFRVETCSASRHQAAIHTRLLRNCVISVVVTPPLVILSE